MCMPCTRLGAAVFGFHAERSGQACALSFRGKPEDAMMGRRGRSSERGCARRWR